ncbi:MAG TPA: transcriptional repressor LexA [Sedimentisphaerales bacterium]|nr:transcriptional repressor LexA [Sedimentisphaerales bacterium]
MQALTKRQQQVLDFIQKRLSSGDSPSQREIAEHFGLAQNAVYQFIGYLKKKGYLQDSTGHRRLRLSKAYQQQIRQDQGIPVVGRAAAGEPILAEENIEAYVKLDEMFGAAEDKFIVRVVGDSMVDEGIMDGDFVVVKPTSAVLNGQTGVVLLDGEATVKRIYMRGDKIALVPANKARGYKTRYVKRNSEDVRIIGRVIGCYRLF